MQAAELVKEQVRYAAGGEGVPAADWRWLQEQAEPALDILQGDQGHSIRLQLDAILAYADAQARGKREAAARTRARKALGDAYCDIHHGRRRGEKGHKDDLASPLGLADALAEGAAEACLRHHFCTDEAQAGRLRDLVRRLDACQGAMAALAVGDGDLRGAAEGRLQGSPAVIFLDVDGVLTSEQSLLDYHARTLKDRIGDEGVITKNQVFWDESCMAMLRRILEASRARVVISSSWRNAHPLSDFSVMLALYGCPADVLAATPYTIGGGLWRLGIERARTVRFSRGDEIQCWLDAHPEVDRYAVLDDFRPELMALPTPQGRERHVHVEERTGLTAADAAQAIALL